MIQNCDFLIRQTKFKILHFLNFLNIIDVKVHKFNAVC